MGEARYMGGEPVKRLLNCVFTESICQLRCHYCYVGQTQAHVARSTPNSHSVAEMRNALSYERLGGRCHMNMCAVGETLLVPEVLALARAFIEEGHLVTLVTNALARREIEEICNWERDYKDNTFIKVSYHYLQLRDKGLKNLFWQNVHLLEASGISYTVELTVNDNSVPLIDEILQECSEELGVPCHVIESRRQDGIDWPRLTQLQVSEHQSAWGRFNSSLFVFQQTIWGQKRREFCYAGDWIASVNMKTGELVPCFGGGHLLDNIYEHPDRPINFQAIGHACPWGHCYAGYVLLSFGAIPEIDTPTYASLRDRESTAGKHWLQAPIRKSFSGKLHKMNHLYSSSRQVWTNFVMDSVYRRTVAPPRETRAHRRWQSRNRQM